MFGAAFEKYKLLNSQIFHHHHFLYPLFNHKKICVGSQQILLITAFGVIALAMIAFNLLMCYGVHQHHLCQVTLLVVVQVIVTLGLGLFFIGFGLVSFQGIILGPVVVAIVAFFFLRDIRQMKEQEQGKG